MEHQAVIVSRDEKKSRKMKALASNKTFIKGLKSTPTPTHKGAFSSKKLKPTELPNKIVDKLNNVDTVDKQKEVLSRENQVKAYCSTKDITKLEEPIVSHTEWAFIPMKVLAYNSPFDLDKDNVFYPIVPFEPNGQTWKIYKEYNNFNKHSLSSTSVENNLDMDVEWLQRQRNYIINMSKYDLFTLRGYTHYGDVLVNSYLRDVIEWDKVRTMNADFLSSFDYFPVYFQLDSIITKMVSHKNKLGLFALFDKSEQTIVKLNTRTTNKNIPKSSSLGRYIDLIATQYTSWKHSDRYIVLVSLWNLLHVSVYKKVIELFHEDLTRIITKSPPLTKDVVVFRGVKNDFYLQGARNGFYNNIGFVSTSLDIEKAQFFQKLGDEHKRGSDCCIQRIILVKGTKALLMMPISQYGDEKEILLNHGSIYKIIEPKVLKTFYNKTYEKSYDICMKDTYQVHVSDIVLTS